MIEQHDQAQATLPSPDRPQLPDGYGVPSNRDGLLPWSHVSDRLSQARNYWFATTRPDGRPHATPVWGVWLDNTLYFDGSPETRRQRNIARNPAVAVHLENGDDVVILEGEAYPVAQPPRTLTTKLAEMYAAKYAGYNPTPDTWDQGGLYAVKLRKVIAWTNLGQDPTRWIFGDEITSR